MSAPAASRTSIIARPCAPAKGGESRGPIGSLIRVLKFGIAVEQKAGTFGVIGLDRLHELVKAGAIRLLPWHDERFFHTPRSPRTHREHARTTIVGKPGKATKLSRPDVRFGSNGIHACARRSDDTEAFSNSAGLTRAS
jgi:hypothetical protein